MDHKDGPPPEIVIIRRGGRGHDDGHHGGAWKIAYADFMTAMMALFLVMWLIGASDEKTIAQVASYFNPVPLTDRTTTEKGVQDLQQGGTGKDEDKKPPKTTELEGNMSPKNALGKREPTDESLFADPYNVLTKLASKAVKVPLPAGSGAVLARTPTPGSPPETSRSATLSIRISATTPRPRTPRPATSSPNMTLRRMSAVPGSKVSRTAPVSPRPKPASPALSPPSRRSRPRRPRRRNWRRPPKNHRPARMAPPLPRRTRSRQNRSRAN